MRAYSLAELDAIVAEAFRRGVETARALAKDAPLPAPPTALEIVDHPFTGSDGADVITRPTWLHNEHTAHRGQVRED